MSALALASRLARQVFKGYLRLDGIGVTQISSYRVTRSDEAAEILKQCDATLADLDKLERSMVDRWAAAVPEQCGRNLASSLLVKNDRTHELALNFHPQLAAILRETHYLQQMGREEIPEAASQLYERGETFRKYTNSLSVTIEW